MQKPSNTLYAAYQQHLEEACRIAPARAAAVYRDNDVAIDTGRGRVIVVLGGVEAHVRGELWLQACKERAQGELQTSTPQPVLGQSFEISFVPK